MSDSSAARRLTEQAQLAWSERSGLRGLSVRRGRWLAAAAAAGVLGFSLLGAADGLRLATFDGWQRLFPRHRASAPVVIVAIDEESLAAHGQWPWPRTLIAALVDRISAQRAAAIGIDVVFAEPDRLSPDRLAPLIAADDPALASRLAALPTHDGQLAKSLAAAPVVLAMAGLPDRSAGASAARASVAAPMVVRGPVPTGLTVHASVLRSLPALDQAARGWGLISAEATGRVLRRVPLASQVDGTLVPAFAVELLRVAAGLPTVTLETGEAGAKALRLGDLRIPTDRDGGVWIHYSLHDQDRFVSARDVLAGRVDAGTFERKIVIVGLTALGLLDFHAVPTGERVPGSEIHAQLLEGIFDDGLLRRTGWIRALEVLLLVAIAALAIFGASRWRPRIGLMAWAAASATLVVLAPLAMRFAGLLLDVAWPLIGGGATFAVMLIAMVTESDRQRRILRRELDEERIAAARHAGEQEAARRVQMGMLPPTDGRGVTDPRVAIAAMAEPARSVGGDLYDYFLLDENRLFVVVGDVSGKGLPAALFMSVAKALLKSAALRRGANLESLLDEAHGELSRDNPGQLFVTLFIGVLDLDSGMLEWCNAGHEPPLLLARGSGPVQRLDGQSGPPLCVIENFPYEVNRTPLKPGDRLCIVTDGITEARGAGGDLLGRERFSHAMAGASATAAGARDFIVELLGQHGGGAELADDATALVVAWLGGRAVSEP